MFDDNTNSTAAATAMTLAALNSAAVASAASTASASVAAPAIINGGLQPSQIVSQLLNAKDSRWLQLEVCREFQRGQCSRTDLECKFAHPPPHVDIQNGRVTACYDSIKGRCTRENPKCKYLHPPQHLKDQLLVNGKQNLAMRNLICSQLSNSTSSAANYQPSPSLPPIAQLIQQPPQLLQQSFPLQFLPPNLSAATVNPALFPASLIQQSINDQYQTANGSVSFLPPHKRQALDTKNTASAATNLLGVVATNAGTAIPPGVYAPAVSSTATQFNPYLMQQIPTAFFPAVSYSLSIPPRF